MNRKGGQSNTSADGGEQKPEGKRFSQGSEKKKMLPGRRFRFLPGDAWIIGGIVLFCVLMIVSITIYTRANRSRERVVRITQDGSIILERSLSGFSEPSEFRITTSSGYIVVYLSSEKVYVMDSSCPDKICMHEGELTKIGDGAVCLPNRVVVQIVSGSGEEKADGKVDVVAK